MILFNKAAEKVELERLQQTGPCHIDELILSRRDLYWGTIVATVEHLSRERRVLFRYGSYEINRNVAIPNQAA